MTRVRKKIRFTSSPNPEAVHGLRTSTFSFPVSDANGNIYPLFPWLTDRPNMNNCVLRIQPGGIRACDEEWKKKPALASPPHPPANCYGRRPEFRRSWASTGRDRVLSPFDTTHHHIELEFNYDLLVMISTLPLHLVNGVAELETQTADPGKASAGRCRSRPRTSISSSPVPHVRKNIPYFLG